MTHGGTLVNGLTVKAEARRRGRGLLVTLWAEPSEVTRAYDRVFEARLRDYLAAAQLGDHAEREFPLTGAEAMMSGVTLRDVDGLASPASVTRESGGAEHPWRVTFRSPDWQPVHVVIAGSGIALNMAVEP